jgi:transcriptional regulator with XRE-family HTH domain
MNNQEKFELTLSLKKLRILREYDQTFVAEKLDISQSGYTKKESGKSEFSASELHKLAELFGKTMDEMYKIINNK